MPKPTGLQVTLKENIELKYSTCHVGYVKITFCPALFG